MVVTVGFLYDKSQKVYKMQCLTGTQGFDSRVSWIHIIENKESALFLHGGELVFCTGSIYNGEEWLLDYIKKLQKSRASGLVINIGPFIRSVPKSVAAFCEQRGFPLFLIPWSVRLVDITRYLCQFIIEEETREQQFLQYFLFILMHPGQCGNACRALRTYGIDIDKAFRVFVVRPAERRRLDEAAAQMSACEPDVHVLTYGDALVCVAPDEGESNAWSRAWEWREYFLGRDLSVTVCVGSAVPSVERLSESYTRASAMTALVSETRPVVQYERVGVYKLLLDGPSPGTLRQFYDDTMKGLDEYDAAHHSSLVETLEYYLSHRCSIKDTAVHEVVHRNTVLYKLNKIETITGKKLNEEEDKLDILIALKIKKLFSIQKDG